MGSFPDLYLVKDYRDHVAQILANLKTFYSKTGKPNGGGMVLYYTYTWYLYF